MDGAMIKDLAMSISGLLYLVINIQLIVALYYGIKLMKKKLVFG